MKILTLELRAFGPFTESVLHFPDGKEGLHIVYGPNEAGKSAALRGLKSLLFGIPERTTDNFVHDNNKLRIGGHIKHSDGSSIFFVRRKGRTNTLLCEDESVLDETVLKKHIGSVGEKLFSRMFGINYQDLVMGGKEIIAGGGDVGESLFAAGIGGIGLREILLGLDKEAEELFTPRGKKIINVRITELNDIKKEIQGAALSGREWEEHNEALKSAQINKEKLIHELTILRSEINRLTRLQKAIPLIAEWKELSSERTNMGEVLILPQDFPEERRQAVETLNHAKSIEKKAIEQLARLKGNLNAISFSPDILKYGKIIEDYHIRLGSHIKALKDLPKLNGEMSQLQADAEAILKELDPNQTIEQAEALRITSAKRQHIRGVGAQYQSLTERLRNTKKSIGMLNTKIQQTQNDLTRLGEPRDIRDLRELIQRVNKQGDLEAELKKIKIELKEEEGNARVELQKLSLWDGSLADLESLPIPSSETIDRFEKEFDSLLSSIEKNEIRIQEAASKASNLRSKIESLELSGAVPTELDLEEARRRRESGWKLIRGAWLQGELDPEEAKSFDPSDPLDKAYEKSVYHADDVADRLRHEAERVAQKSTWIAELDRLGKELSSYEVNKNNLTENRFSLSAEWNSLWQTTGIKPLTPKEMSSWMQKQDALVRRAERIRNLHLNISQIEERIDEYKNLLIKCISLLGEPKTDPSLALHSLIDRGQSLIDNIEKQKSQRETLKKFLYDLNSQIKEAQNEEKIASEELSKWQIAWGKAVKEIGLDETTLPSAANIILDRNQDFFTKFDEIIKLRRRMEGISRDKSEYANDIKYLAKRVTPDLAELPFDQIAVELHTRYTKTREDSATHTQLKDRYQEVEQELEKARSSIREMTDKLNGLCRQTKCHKFEELEGIEKQSSIAWDLDQKIGQLKRQLFTHAAGGTFQKLINEAEKINPDSLPSLIRENEEKVRGIENSLSEIDQKIGRENTELEKMDGSSKAADAAERAQAVLAQIHSAAERYIRLRAASSILLAEIERYRTKNQGPILKRASEIFSLLTLQSFSRLKINYGDDDKPFLVGVRSNGEEVTTAGMSDGTSDQLYLSLRLASLEKYLHTNEPLPFIVDDILINFDDKRSEAVLKVLSELSRETQVILFTHHNHLIEIAKKVITPEILHLHSLR